MKKFIGVITIAAVFTLLMILPGFVLFIVGTVMNEILSDAFLPGKNGGAR